MQMLSHKESIVTMIAKGLAGGDWPATVMFKVEYRSKTASQEWGEVQAEFFYSKDELDQWVTEIVDWTTEDGNHFEYHLYEWEHGPKYVTTVSFP